MSKSSEKQNPVKERRCLKCSKLFVTAITKCPYCGGSLRENTPENQKKQYLED